MKFPTLSGLGLFLLGGLGAASVQAQAVLRITEVMSNGDTVNGGATDWFELTNLGDAPATITGYKVDDGSWGIPSTQQIALNGITTIAPGESVVFIEGPLANVATFKQNWGLNNSVQVGYYSGSGVGFSSGGDGVTIFDASGNELSGASNSGYLSGKIRLSFGVASSTYSFWWGYSPEGEFEGNMQISAFGDVQGTFTSVIGCTGSPGRITRPPALQFTSQAPQYAKVGSLLSYSFGFLTSNPNETAAVTAPVTPAWLTLNGSSSGSTLSGTPGTNDIGTNNLVTLRLVGTNKVVTVVGSVTNTNTVTTTNEQTFRLMVFPASSPVIVNEYNAVSSGNVLDTSKQSGRPGSDSRLGIVSGNGGNWLELVVVGNGTEGATVNLQGWRIEISDVDGTGSRVTDTLVLSATHPQWAAVPAGTLLTFTENNAAAGGFDTAFNADDQRLTAGWTWSNVWMGDTNLISSRTWADGVGLSTLSQNQTQITLKDASGNLVQGPVGEGISPTGDGLVTSKKVMALQANPVPGVVPYDAAYVDSMQSSFGKPNPIVTKTTGRTSGIQAFFGKSPAPFFTVLPLNLAIANQRYGGADIYANNIEIFQVNLNDLTFSARRKNGGPLPSWLGFQQDFEFVNLSGTPGSADVGLLELELVAKDNVSNIETVQPLTIQVLADTSPVLLNEYNAVGSSDQLGDGTGSDTFFGLVDGNGGPWLELVVVGDGTAGSTVNLQGWRIEIDDAAGTAFVPDEVIVLSGDAYWGGVPAGTLLTFGDRGTAEGGLDTWIHKVNQLGQAAGYAWTHILVHDPVYVDQAASTFGGGLGISSAGTQFRIVRPDGSVAAGPFGEGLKTLPGVNSTEVFRLAANPHPGITPLDPGYTDSTSSSFGSPNTSQSLGAYQTSNSAPVFTNLPTKYAVEGQGYSWTAGTADAENNSVALTKVSGPAWLSVSGKTLSGTPPQNSAGFYDVSLSATDGTASTPLQFRLTVFNDNPSLILNEYNAVDNSGTTLAYLDGGTQAQDSAGGTASDVHFGRVAGNGGDWVECVVTGNGSAGTTDLRGWTIEIDEGAGSGFFAAKVRIQLSQNIFWAAVPNGTILTFTESNTSQGGMDTNLSAANNSATSGWRWANVWIGDSSLITYTDLATNGYSLISGVVDGINIDDTETQFRVLNPSGYPVFGPAGEGIAPVTGIGPTDVLELEGHPTAAVLPTDRSDDTVTPPKNGYDNSTKDSTFGAPNQWHFGSGGVLTTQDFTPYKGSAGSTPYDATFGSWASAAGQGSISMTSDADGNGLTALLEYAYGAAAPGSISRTLLPANSTTNSGGTNYLVLNYFVRTSGVTVMPEVNTTLGTSGWGTNGVSSTVVGTVTTNNTTLQQRRATVPVDGTGKFLRLKATSP